MSSETHNIDDLLLMIETLAISLKAIETSDNSMPLYYIDNNDDASTQINDMVSWCYGLNYDGKQSGSQE